MMCGLRLCAKILNLTQFECFCALLQSSAAQCMWSTCTNGFQALLERVGNLHFSTLSASTSRLSHHILYALLKLLLLEAFCET